MARQFEFVSSSSARTSSTGNVLTTAMLVILTASSCAAQSPQPRVHPFEAPPL